MQINLTPRQVELFWSKASVADTDKCWLWTAWTDNRGRAYFAWSAGRREVRSTTAARVAWTLTNGAIPDGLFVLHKCDNPLCVNPTHLRLGTHIDNMNDMIQRGRAHFQTDPEQFRANRIGKAGMPGELNSQAKLTADDVREIRRLLANHAASQSELARKYGVNPKTINLIASRKNWPHI